MFEGSSTSDLYPIIILVNFINREMIKNDGGWPISSCFFIYGFTLFIK